MAKYRFEQIAINCTEKKMPTDEGRLTYIGLEHLDTGCLTISRWGSAVPLKGEKLVMRRGDVLLGKRNAYLRRAAIAPHDGIFSAHGMVLRPREEVIDKAFFPLFIASDYFFDEAIRISVGSLSPTVNWKDLRITEFELPDLETQRKLASVLWAINDTIEAYKRLISVTDELVKSQFIEMFGDPLTNPMGWPTEGLSSLGELARGVSKARPRNRPELLGGSYPLVQTGEITNSGVYIKNYENTYSEAGLAQSKLWPKDTLCITIAANIGQTGILAFDACFPDSVVGFISDGSVEQIFMHFYFTFFQKTLESQATQVAQKNINLKLLSDLQVIVPPLPLQKQFSAFVRQSDKSQFIEWFGDPASNPFCWEVSSIGGIASDVRYGTSRAAVGGGKYPYLRMNNLTADGKLDLSDLKYIDLPGSELEKCLVHKGDILFNRTNSKEWVGKTALFDLDEDMVIAGYIVRVRVKPYILPSFVVAYMNLPYMKKILKSMAKGAVHQANISAD